MTTRPVPTILDEWRTLESALHEATDAAERIDIDRGLAALAEEHRVAVETQQADADAFGAVPATGAAEA